MRVKELRTMMGWYQDGMGWGGWLLMTLAMVAFLALVVFTLVALSRVNQHGPARRTPKQILDERFASGEIDEAEYQVRRDALRGEAHGSPSSGGTVRRP